MFRSYEYTPYIWFIFPSVILLTVLLIQAFRNRTAPGGIPSVFLFSIVIIWLLVKLLSLSSTDDMVRIFWFKVQAALLLPTVTSALCFAIEYAGFGRFLNRRILILMAIAPIVFLIMIATNHIHHLIWTRIWFEDYVRSDNGLGFYYAIAYLYLLGLLHLSILIWLFVQSPRHRWIASLLIVSLLSTRIANFIEVIMANHGRHIELTIVVITLALVPYSLAMFSLRLFDVVAIARNVIIEKMTDIMIVLDTGNRIVDMNVAAQKIFNVTKSKIIGCQFEDGLPELKKFIGNLEIIPNEICLAGIHYYQISHIPLIDDRNFQLGYLILLHEITDLKRAQTQLLDNQRILAILNERELLARKLHDGVGQLLAAANLQANSALEFIKRGDELSVESCLKRLNEVTQEAKESIREYLLGVKANSSIKQGLVPVVRKYLNDYSHTYGIHTELVAPANIENQIGSVVEEQLFSIIQEALTNARRHGKASSVQVIFTTYDGYLQVNIQDNGKGFNAQDIEQKQGFGLRSMQGRAKDAGGFFEVISENDKGTLISIRLPRQKENI